MDVLFLYLYPRQMENIHLPTKSINDRVRDYYRGERVSNALLFFIGGGALTWTLLLFLWRQGQLSTGLFYSTVPLSLFFIITGAYRFVRSFKRYNNAQDNISGFTFLVDEELPHLQARHGRFLQKRKVDLVGLSIGFLLIALAVLGGWNHLILGTSISLTAFSGLLLVFDLFGQFRTTELIHHLRKL